MTKRKTGGIIYAVGAIVLVAGAFLFVLRADSCHNAVPWIFGMGVLLDVIGRVLTLPEPVNRRVRRLSGLIAISGILLIVAAYLVWRGNDDAVLLILISAVIDFWFTMRIKQAQNDPKA